MFRVKRRNIRGEMSGRPRVRKPARAAQRDTLREKERGDAPHCFSWGFFIARMNRRQVRHLMRQRRIGIACGVIALLCGAVVRASAMEQSKAETKPVAKSDAKPAKPMTREVIDESGRRVAVPMDVRRIVSLAPNLTEIVYALGAQDRLVAVSNYSDSVPAAKTKPHVGMPMNPSLEAIVGARPDIVLAAAINQWETVDALARLGIPGYTTDPHTVEGMLESIKDIGGVIGASAQAATVVANLQQRLDALKTKLAGVPPARVLFVVWENPLISVGGHTFIADALRWADAESVLHTKQNWPQISLEEVVRLKPDYLVFASNHAGDAASNAQRLAELRSEGGWQELSPVRDGRIAVISDEVNLPAPGLIDAIEQLARELHPDVFKATRATHARASRSSMQADATSHFDSRFAGCWPAAPSPNLSAEATACGR